MNGLLGGTLLVGGLGPLPLPQGLNPAMPELLSIYPTLSDKEIRVPPK